MTRRRTDLRIARARRELAEAVEADLLDVVEHLDEAVARLAEVGTHAGGIGGLRSLCSGQSQTLTDHRDALLAAAERYREDLTRTPDPAPRPTVSAPPPPEDLAPTREEPTEQLPEDEEAAASGRARDNLEY